MNTQSGSSAGTSSLKTLTLRKGKHYYCFRYEEGQESQVLDALIDLVHRPELNFNWFDAAVISHQLGHHLALQLKQGCKRNAA